MKYEFESDKELVEFADKFFSNMGITDDLKHPIKLRDEFRSDLILNTGIDSPKELLKI